MNVTLDQYKSMQRHVWCSGDHAAMASHLEDAAADLVHRLGLIPGVRVLDIATGTGNAAILAAKAGADVVGIDIAPELFDDAEARADELGLQIQWREGDAEALPYRDGVFDRVVSSFGVMFAPRHHRAARELVRVLRPGGRFALSSWISRGVVDVVYQAFDGLPHLPPWAMSPRKWGDPDHIREIFDGLDVELQFDTGAVRWVFASPEDCMSYVEEIAGPVIAAKAALHAQGRWLETRASIINGLGEMVREDVGGCWINAEYLVVTGIRLR